MYEKIKFLKKEIEDEKTAISVFAHSKNSQLFRESKARFCAASQLEMGTTTHHFGESSCFMIHQS